MGTLIKEETKKHENFMSIPVKNLNLESKNKNLPSIVINGNEGNALAKSFY